ncbi:hypothetical protein BCR43DRAFT_484317 [Syncephalastrum racemosum]|uniref:Peptidase M20 domain-containing protein 2 n=1 Tax=Syncephalastrum racemosum TaxID=13706 RepID=A0A1X2HY11_SYNRA|nr:hypothetical protein BCR43DRAFT_484317 [Syncephalastrum racemosum]
MNKPVEKVIDDTIAELSAELRKISLQIHANPELGNHEYKASALLADYLESKGMDVTRHADGMETAFIAEYSNGSGRRVGFCSEYDALPGIGHGCGHNLIAISGVACALAIKALLERKLLQGTVVLFGTPAEEEMGGKKIFVKKEEVQKRNDFNLMLHPYPGDVMYCNMLAVDTANVEFFGKAAHAGMAPWKGINALDALMQAWDNLAMFRQQTLPTNRIHGIIKDGGKRPNVIPDYASAQFLCRSLTRNQLVELKAKFENCVRAAAVATKAECKITWDENGMTEDVFMNEPLTETFKHFMGQEGVEYKPRAEEEKISSGSSDYGAISYVIPASHPHFGIGTRAANHTVEFTNAAATEYAHTCTIRASRCAAKTAAAVMLDQDLYTAVQADFRKGKSQ